MRKRRRIKLKRRQTRPARYLWWRDVWYRKAWPVRDDDDDE